MYEWWPTRERPYPGVLFVFRYRLRTLALTSPVCGICKQSMGTFLWERLPDEQRSTHLEIEALAAAEGLNPRISAPDLRRRRRAARAGRSWERGTRRWATRMGGRRMRRWVLARQAAAAGQTMGKSRTRKGEKRSKERRKRSTKNWRGRWKRG